MRTLVFIVSVAAALAAQAADKVLTNPTLSLSAA